MKRMRPLEVFGLPCVVHPGCSTEKQALALCELTLHSRSAALSTATSRGNPNVLHQKSQEEMAHMSPSLPRGLTSTLHFDNFKVSKQVVPTLVCPKVSPQVNRNAIKYIICYVYAKSRKQSMHQIVTSVFKSKIAGPPDKVIKY